MLTHEQTNERKPTAAQPPAETVITPFYVCCFSAFNHANCKPYIIMPPPLGQGALSDDACLTSVCLTS